jgi:hypothetical protein
MPNPENILIREDRKAIMDSTSLSTQEKAAELKELPLKPDLSTGEDSIFRVHRKIVPSKFTNRSTIGVNENLDYDMYVEYESKFSAQESQFKNSLQENTFREIQGRPPQGDHLQDRFGVPDKTTISNVSSKQLDYYISSSVEPGEKYEYIYELSVDTRFWDQALNAAKFDLDLQNLDANTVSINLAWDYPNVRPGDFLEIQDQIEQLGKKLMIKDLNLNYSVQGYLDGVRVITSEGTQITGGYLSDDTNLKVEKRLKSDLDLNMRPIFSSESSIDTTGSFLPERSRRNNG